jgi:hypothetical protein
MCDEPKNGLLDIVASNDTQGEAKGSYTITELTTGVEVAKGDFAVEANGKAILGTLPEIKNKFYLIRWSSTAGDGVNHFVCAIGDGWTWEGYKACMQKAGFFDEFEGF